jgi:transcriptional repressor NrdR
MKDFVETLDDLSRQEASNNIPIEGEYCQCHESSAHTVAIAD